MKNTLSSLFLLILLTTWGAMAQQNQPNIIFILADDLGYGDLGCFGSKVIKTPALDKMAQEGTKLTQFYSGSTVCTPSRNALMTGQHTGHLYLRGNSEDALRLEDETVAEVLKKAGYQTAMFGKWGLGDIGTTGEPSKQGWDSFYGLLHNVEAHYQFPAIVWESTPEALTLKRVSISSFGSDVYFNKAIDWMKNRDKTKPFFAYLSFPIPHAEIVPPQEAMKQYRTNEGKSIFEEKPFVGSHYGGQNEPKAAYVALVSRLDSYVGKLLDFLKENQLDQNTLVIFTSDNGTHIEGGRTMTDVELMQSSGPFRGVKRDLYEGGIRVPTIVWGNGIAAGKTNTTIGAFWDILPTFAELTNAQTSTQLDGVSLWKNWLNDSPINERPLYWEFYERGFAKAMRLGKWKYIYQKPENGRTKEELFDLEKDLKEANDLSNLHPEQLKTMRDYSEKMHTQSTIKEFQLEGEY